MVFSTKQLALNPWAQCIYIFAHIFIYINNNQRKRGYQFEMVRAWEWLREERERDKWCDYILIKNVKKSITSEVVIFDKTLK